MSETGGLSSHCRAGSAAPSWRSGYTAFSPPDALTVVANTGDDFEHLGLSISPDIDTLLYTLSVSTIANPAGAGATKPGPS